MALDISTQYRYSGKGPFDAKQLVKTYADLISEATWLSDSGSNTAYNGMIVAVWLDKNEDKTLSNRNGIYLLFDPNCTSTIKKPDVTKEANWHKLADASALSDVVASIENNAQAIAAEETARIAAIASIYNTNTDGTVTGLLAEEIARAKTAEQANVAVISALVGDDHNKTVRTIASEEVAKLVDTGDKTVSAYVSDRIAKLVMPKASEEVTMAEDGTLGLGEVSTDKFVQGSMTLVLRGGDAS